MENNLNPTPEELEKMIEKAKADLQAALDKMTPEEREQAELNAQKLIAEDQANMQRMIDEAKSFAVGTSQKEQPKFCPNCGAPVNGGNFCPYCGGSLQNG